MDHKSIIQPLKTLTIKNKTSMIQQLRHTHYQDIKYQMKFSRIRSEIKNRILTFIFSKWKVFPFNIPK